MEQASGRWEGSRGAYFTQDDLGGQVLRGPTQGQVRPFTAARNRSLSPAGWDGRLAGRGREGSGRGHLGLP